MNTEIDSGENRDSKLRRRAAGTILIVASLLFVLVMTHHPSSSGRNFKDAVEELAHSHVGSVVHGMLIVLAGITLCGFLEVSRRLGLERLTTRAGLLAYGSGLAAQIVAALANGFVAPLLAARYVSADAEALDILRHLFNVIAAASQVAAYFGAALMSLGIVLWSLVLLRRSGAQWVGWVGIGAGIIPVVLLAAGIIRMDVFGVTLLFATQTLWNVLLGSLLLRGKL